MIFMRSKGEKEGQEKEERKKSERERELNFDFFHTENKLIILSQWKMILINQIALTFGKTGFP